MTNTEPMYTFCKSPHSYKQTNTHICRIKREKGTYLLNVTADAAMPAAFDVYDGILQKVWYRQILTVVAEFIRVLLHM